MARDRSNRFNAKGRQSGLNKLKEDSKRKERKKAGISQEAGDSDGDANTDIIVPKTKEQKEIDKERKLEMRKQLESEQEGKISSKKRKRLDAFITRQLKKEERKELIDKLSIDGYRKSQSASDAAYLKSSANLGSRLQHTAEDKIALSEHLAVKSAMKKAGSRNGPAESVDDQSHSDSEVSDDSDDEISHPIAKPEPTKEQERIISTKKKAAVVDDKAQMQQPTQKPTESTLGSALGAGGVTPVIRPRKKKTKTIPALTRGWKIPSKEEEPAESERESDTSFDSSASESGEDDEDNKDHSEDEEMSEDDRSDEEEPQTERGQKFKEWALRQMNDDAEPKIDEVVTQIPEHYKKSAGPERALADKIELPSNSLLQESDDASIVRTVPIKRSEELQTSRLLLPVVELEQEIVETVLLNPITVICGETGSGKTTQLPQFLYERGFGTKQSLNPGMIAVTQPRRVAAVSMANRVGEELGVGSPKAAYKIRYDGNTSPETAIKFMTDGVLLRELANDFLLTKYSVIIVDEAHERSVNTDILIGVLSRVVSLRNNRWKKNPEDIQPLRLIIMSATLRVSDFTENKALFQQTPPVINVSARQHPVTIHFSKKTTPDYVEEAMNKTIKIHKKLPPGGVLVFLTGQGEIETVCKKLRQRFGKKTKSKSESTNNKLRSSNPAAGDVEIEDVDFGNDDDPALDIDDDLDEEVDSGDESGFEEAVEEETSIGAMHVLPLYSLLPSEKQMQVFEPPPEGTRLVVIATNVAETSLTIPGIRYVVDSGRAKERSYNPQNGMQSFDVSWVSKASAAQRAGRAGRTGPGHTYRLYSSAVFENHFEQFAKPEILRMPIEGVVLQMKSMNLDVVDNFPFPTPPDVIGLNKAEKMLLNLGALTDTALSQVKSRFKITELGRSMSLFPVTPRFAKMLVTGFQHGCLPYVIAIVSALSVGDPFIHEEALKATMNDDDSEDVRQAMRKAFFKSHQKFASLGNHSSDLFKVLAAVGAYEYAGGGEAFCKSNFLRSKAMGEIRKLRAQISYLIQSTFPNVDANFVPKLNPPNETQQKVLKQLIAAGFIEQVAVRKDLVEETENSGKKFQSCRNIPYKAVGIDQDVYIHPSSTIFNGEPPGFITYTEIIQTSQPYMKGITAIEASWLHKLGRNMCRFSKPIDVPLNAKLASSETKKEVIVEPFFGPGRGIKLPAVKMEQVKDSHGRWILA
ncbi:P-loop containing nucleoside triphosphate hydrolase protein [Wallemia mellicola]|nr:P-loop containing nucleoside triphosphate hydrolase protein [Wallemia mellicola]